MPRPEHRLAVILPIRTGRAPVQARSFALGIREWRPGRPRRPILAVLMLSTWMGIAPAWGQDGSAPLARETLRVAALGRLSPKGGVVRVAGPSEPVIVIRSLLVEKGDRVTMGQELARLDTYSIRQAALAPIVAELENAQAELERSTKLRSGAAELLEE